MTNILTIIKKELKRFFTDKRMLASIILPGVLIFLIYSVMGSVISNVSSVDNDYEYQVYTINQPQIIDELFKGININYVDYGDKDLEALKQDVTDEVVDLLIIFSDNFANLGNPDLEKPSVEMYYNSIRTESLNIFQITNAILNELDTQIVGTSMNVTFQDTASEKEISSTFISMMLPYLLLVLMFSGVMAIVPESIAGEKERGTIATLLVTPLKRRDLAIGKIIGLSIISLCSAISSFIGTLLSLPKLMQMQNGSSLTGVYYNVLDYLYISLILISVILLFVGILAIISAFSKSVKEASAYATPIMIIVVVIGVFSMFGNVSNNIGLYFIPIYNSVACLTAILSFEANLINIIVTVVSNIFYALLCALILSRLFNSEKVMFSK